MTEYGEQRISVINTYCGTVIQVGDIKYDYELLRMGFDVGAVLKIVKKDGDTVSFERLYAIEEAMKASEDEARIKALARKAEASQ